MRSAGYHVFETPIGVCAIAWVQSEGDNFLITHFQLPEASRQNTEARIARHSTGIAFVETPIFIAKVIARVQQHLVGEREDFRDLRYDLDTVPEFSRQVYLAILDIPAGQTTTYGALARRLGQPGAAQAVGQALGNNPIPLLIPCHRVLAAGGAPGGFSAHGGLDTKTKLLEIEGAARNLTLEF
jgi:methylated-DNA-[protein]-cysteine S-methyltransferase